MRRYVTEGETALFIPFCSRYAPHTAPLGAGSSFKIHAQVLHSIRRWDAESLPAPRR